MNFQVFLISAFKFTYLRTWINPLVLLVFDVKFDTVCQLCVPVAQFLQLLHDKLAHISPFAQLPVTLHPCFNKPLIIDLLHVTQYSGCTNDVNCLHKLQ